jgi:hypothetical protein
VGELLKQPTHDIGFNAATGEYVNMIQKGDDNDDNDDDDDAYDDVY